MPEKRKILCLSFDKMVGDMRCDVLTEAGYEVTGETLAEYAFELLERHRFDLVIIGHRFDTKTKQELALSCQNHKTRVLLVCGRSEEREIAADGRVYALEGTVGLLKSVSGLFGERKAAGEAA